MSPFAGSREGRPADRDAVSQGTAGGAPRDENSNIQHIDASEADASTPLLQRSGHPPSTSRRTERGPLLCRLLTAVLVLGILLSIAGTVLPLTTSPLSDQATSLFPNATLTNGTHTFRRTVILLSLDGAKPSYLTPDLAPSLQALGTSTPNSRRASYMQPIFPTLTFPNHWSLLTGLLASSHGIVGNDFHDVSTGKQFYYTKPDQSWDARWWKGEPIWATAERSGVSSAVLMWPGPPTTQAGWRARYFQKYESGPEWGLKGRLEQVLKWIDTEEVGERPSLICAYVPDIDQAAHRFGPDSDEATDAVKAVDAFIGQLHQELGKRSLEQVVDVVVVSDHGMTTTSNHKLIFLDELLGHELYGKVEYRDGWPSAGLRFKGTRQEQQHLVQQAFDRLSSLNDSLRRGWKVYTRTTLPSRYHLSSPSVEDRLAPLWLIPELGWSITDHAEMSTFADGVYAPRGNHGYDNEEEEMHAIFVASGPSFAPLSKSEKGKGGANMDGFRNVEVHNLISRILGVPESKRAATNGTWSFWDRHLRAGL